MRGVRTEAWNKGPAQCRYMKSLEQKESIPVTIPATFESWACNAGHPREGEISRFSLAAVGLASSLERTGCYAAFLGQRTRTGSLKREDALPSPLRQPLCCICPCDRSAEVAGAPPCWVAGLSDPCLVWQLLQLPWTTDASFFKSSPSQRLSCFPGFKLPHPHFDRTQAVVLTQRLLSPKTCSRERGSTAAPRGAFLSFICKGLKPNFIIPLSRGSTVCSWCSVFCQLL